MTKQYVQHMSGQGEKWEVESDNNIAWIVKNHRRKDYELDLPKSEYELVEPPERWVDVTEQFTEGNIQTAWLSQGFRIRKVQFPSNENVNFKSWAFLVERRKP